MNARKLVTLLAGACALAAATACSSGADDGAGSDEGEVKTDKDFYGNDRVGKALKGHPELIPATLLDFEKLFKVGRACERIDSKEIFVVEESQTRLSMNVPEENMHDVTKTKLMPRAVITGCNTGDLTDPNSVKNSYSLFAALISDPNMHDSDKGDTMRMWPLEVMALDDTTGLYNFYVFEPLNMPQDVWASVPLGTPGKVTRIFRAKEDRPGKAGQGEFKVFQQKLQKGKAPSEVMQPAGGGNRCFNCHPNGAPLMNEIVDPWTNWVSFKSTLPKAQLWGETQTLVAEAIPDPAKGTSSLANDLEPIMRSAIQNYVFGPKSSKTTGWALKTLNGELPGGLPKMLESVFCQTELNYGSASAAIPMEVFLDPDVAALGALTPPTSWGDDKTPFQLPIRSIRDKETERWLVNRGYLEDADVKAIRIIDDENDIFSTTRCGLLKDVTTGLPSGDPAVIRAHIRTTVKAKVASMPWAATQPKRKAFVDALLTPGIRRETAQRDYFAELSVRYDKADKSITAVKAKERARKARAREMFDNPRSTPLPILDAPR
jgi:hypothetical protein